MLDQRSGGPHSNREMMILAIDGCDDEDDDGHEHEYADDSDDDDYGDVGI